LLVVAEFDEWRVLAYGPGVTLHGTRQFGEAKAKEHAFHVAESYLRQEKPDEALPPPELNWLATTPHDWMLWRG
jgi:hypothetical protein